MSGGWICFRVGGFNIIFTEGHVFLMVSFKGPPTVKDMLGCIEKICKLITNLPPKKDDLNSKLYCQVQVEAGAKHTARKPLATATITAARIVQTASHWCENTVDPVDFHLCWILT